jgi:SDR family mycofactocin-dependent oxidoreductase
MPALDGRVAFITGVARGQGRSHAVRLATDGADIIGIDICENIASNGYSLASREELDETISMVESKGRQMVGSVADVRDFQAVRDTLDAAVARLGRLDIVCANAGIAPMSFRRLTWEEDLEQWADVVGVNLTGAFHTAKAAIPHLVSGGRGGSIIFTSSTAGLRGFPDGGASILGYAASKHGVVGLMRSLANHLARHNIRVNSVHPTAVRTMMAINPGMVDWLEKHPGGAAQFQNPMPVDMLEPEDISAAVAFLASDEAKWITGVTLPVDAGFANRL